jgi:hypothetical protein
MSYVPPHLRNQGSTSPTSPTTTTYQTYQTYTRQDLTSHFGCQVQNMHTLCASTQAPERLTHILIFRGQHPEYPTLFVHSNLQALQPLSSNGISARDRSQAPGFIPVFKQVPRGQRFEFNSWMRIGRIKQLAPHSAELKEMLGRKWKNKGRDEDAWRESLSMPWAEVTLERVRPQPGAPSISHVEK